MGAARKHNKTQGGKILLNNTQKLYNTNFSVWECNIDSRGGGGWVGGGSNLLHTVALLCLQLVKNSTARVKHGALF